MLATFLALIQITTYFIALTLAGYILSRSRFQPLALVTAGILSSYALIQADQFIGSSFEGKTEWVGRFLWLVYPLPVALWVRMAILLKPSPELDLTLDRIWWTLLLPITMLFILGGWLGDDLVNFATHEKGSLYWTFGLYNVVLATGALWQLHLNYQKLAPDDKMRRVFAILRLAGAGYITSMLILLSGVLAPAWVFALLALDIVLLGIGGIAYEALAEGQSIQQDLTMTFIKGGFITIVVVMPWAVALMISNVQTLPLAIALFFSQGVIALGISLQDDFENLLERLILPTPNLQRQELRTLLLNESRRPKNAPLFSSTPPDEFIRLTRRALSHMPNLPRLAASPLTELQIVSTRLEENANALQRANELRQVLAECIQTLRPQERGAFGTSDEWRFFNALYYPYVAGISPYKRSLPNEKADAELHTILEWFQTAVPPRTLYNWQNRGAEMIATILLAQEKNELQVGE